MRFFHDSVFSLQYSPRLQVSSPLSTRSFCESILFYTMLSSDTLQRYVCMQI